MINGMTTSGYEFELDEAMLDDYELLEDLCELDKGDTSRVVNVARAVLGEEQLSQLKEHCRNEDTGRVSATKMIEEVAEIIRSTAAGKNS